MLHNSDKTKIGYYQQEFASRTAKKEEKTTAGDSKHNTFHPWKKLPARLQKHTLTSFGGFHDLFYFSQTSKENSQSANEILLKRIFPSHKIPKDTADKKIDFAKEFRNAREQHKNAARYGVEKKNITPRQEKLLICFKEGRLADIQKENVTFGELFGVEDGDEISLIVWAAKKGHQAILDYFYGEVLKRAPANADIDHPIVWKTTLFYWAAAFNQIDVVRTLLSTNKVQVNEKFECDETALWIAANMGNSQIVQLLIDNKADVNAANKNGIPAIYAAANCDHLAVAECLLEHHAQVDTACKEYKTTALMTAAKNNYIAMIELLLMHKAAINKTNVLNQTSMMMARNSYEAVELLLRHGADPSIKDKNNKTAFDFATCPHVKKLLGPLEMDTLMKSSNGPGFFNSKPDEFLLQLQNAMASNNVEAIEKLESQLQTYQRALNLAKACKPSSAQSPAPRG